MRLYRCALSCGVCIALALSGCRDRDVGDGADRSAAALSQPAAAGELSDWPKVDSAIKPDAAIETRIKEILAGMSLAQKVGQMTQAEIKSITPDEVRRYYIGSVLNGGGSWPGKNKHAAVGDWLALADSYYDASMSTDMKVQVPIIWGTDAVHGHSNVYGATIFPHNIGLGAAHDPALIGKIAAATGKAVRATGVDWLFAPAVPVVQNARWGRTYESWSEDPALVREYATAYTRGLQGTFADDANAVASVKHYLGDGGTDNGKDQGVTRSTLRNLINVHGAGYFGALGAGAQTVMVSYNSWQDADSGKDYGKMHGNKALLTDALKTKMGFDGFTVSDWNAIAQVPGCSNASCAQAINAGIDMIMVPDDWRAFIDNTMKQVESGEIQLARIDDAVTRILRVKLRAGVFDGKKPSQNAYGGKPEAVQDRELAREAVRKSLVLLKNNNAALPLAPGRKILVVGKSADNISNQTGGWSLTWQGTDNSNADFPNAESILAGIREAAGAGNVVFKENAEGVDVGDFDAVIAVIGETPYAETTGDIVPSSTVSHSARFPEDLAVLKAVSGKGKPVVTVFLSGRPLYVNDLLNLSDAFVAAWLPGTEGKGVADVLFADAGGKPAQDFSGSLSFSWPGIACPGPRAAGKDGAAPQFAFGYGLRYASPKDVGELPVAMPAQGCGEATSIAIFNLTDTAPYALHVASTSDQRALGADLNKTIEWPDGKPLLRVRTVQLNTQQDAKEVTWLGPARFLSRSPGATNFNPMRMADAALQFDVRVSTAPTGPVLLTMGCGATCKGEVPIGKVFAGFAPGSKHTVKVPLSCFAGHGTDLANVDVPFSISADAPFTAAFTKVQIVAGAGKDADALVCSALH